MITSLPPGTAERVRCIVEDAFGPGYWDGFQGYICEDSGMHGHEWRFGGALGFGGKLSLSGGRLYVSCYPDDLTLVRRIAMDQVNADLAGVLADLCSLPSRETEQTK